MARLFLAFTSLLCLSLFLLPAAATRASPREAEYAELDVAGVFREVVRGQPAAAGPQRSSWSLEIIHRDSLPSARNATAEQQRSYEQRFARKLRRDEAHVKAIQEKFQKKVSQTAEPGGFFRAEAVFESPVVSGFETGSGEYFVRIGVGTPPKDQYMVLDTGSDVVWLQCQPCRKCYQQADPIFDPYSSASFSAVGCDTPVCSQLDDSDCHAGRCRYRVAYGDGSHTLGSVATESLTFGATTVRNVAIGCGHDNDGLFVGAGGLLGLGAGPLSFASQIGSQTGGIFSFCLVDRLSESAGSLDFGSRATSSASIFVPLLINPALPAFYYVSLTGILVGGSVVDFPRAAGGADVIIDSGTAFTRLEESVYAAARDAFVASAAHLQRISGGYSIFDTCYDFSGMASAKVPTVALVFAGGTIVMLPPENYMVDADRRGTFCFAMAPTRVGPSIIGNAQLQRFRVTFDTANSVVGFAANQC